MGQDDVVNLLGQNLDEDQAADEKLSNLADGGINREAADGAVTEEQEDATAVRVGLEKHVAKATSR